MSSNRLALIFVFLTILFRQGWLQAQDTTTRFPTVTYPYRSIQEGFRGLCFCEDANGLIYSGGNLGINRFDGARWKTISANRTTLLIGNNQEMIYGQGNTIFRFKALNSPQIDVVDLGEKLVSLGLPEKRQDQFRDVARVGNTIYFSQTWFIAKFRIHADGTDDVCLITRKQALPDHLKFRRVFQCMGRAMVQLERLDDSNSTVFGWLEEDGSVKILESTAVNDHITSCVEVKNALSSGDKESEPNFLCCSMNSVFRFNGEMNEVKIENKPTTHRGMIKLMALRDGKFAVHFANESVRVIDENGRFYFTIGKVQLSMQSGCFLDRLDRVWLVGESEISRVDFAVNNRFWRIPSNQQIVSVVINDLNVIVSTTSSVFIAKLRWFDGQPSLSEFSRVVFFDTSYDPTLFQLENEIYLGTWTAFYKFNVEHPEQEHEKILDFTCTDLIHDPRTNAIYTCSCVAPAPIRKFIFHEGRWNLEKEFSSRNSHAKSIGLSSSNEIWFGLFDNDKGKKVARITTSNDAMHVYPCPGNPFFFEDHVYAYSAMKNKFFRYSREADEFAEDQEFNSLLDSSPMRQKLQGVAEIYTEAGGDLCFTSGFETMIRVRRIDGYLQTFLSKNRASAVFRCKDRFGNIWRSKIDRLYFQKRGVSTEFSNSDNQPQRVMFGSVELTSSADSDLKNQLSSQGEPGSIRTEVSLSLPMSRLEPWSDSTSFTNSSGTLTIEYSLPSLREPESVLYTTRMVGQNKNWSAPSPESHRRFPSMNCGEYTFQVRAILPNGSITEVSSLNVIVRPKWFQRTSTKVGMIGLITLVVMGLSFIFVAKERKNVARLKTEVETRKNTEQKLMESQIEVVRRERFKAVGEMAAGVAHDVNNILSPISVFSALVDGKENNEEAVASFVKITRTCVRDAAEIIKRLHPLHRSVPNSLTSIDLSKVIGQVTKIGKQDAIDNQKGITFSVANTVPYLVANETDIREVLLNFVNNSIEAIDSQGMIDIECTRHINEVIIAVSDNGCGMTEEVRKQCLETFYSTKSTVGHGLGLATTHAIVQSYSGRLEIESTPGKGSKFLVIMPGDISLPNLYDIDDTLRSSNILLVEDVDLTRDAIKLLLEKMEQRVVCVSSDVALDAIAPNNIDIVITDFQMPEPNGYDLCKAIRKDFPHVRTILMTGYEQPGMREVCDAFISKPVHVEDLTERLLAVQKMSAFMEVNKEET